MRMWTQTGSGGSAGDSSKTSIDGDPLTSSISSSPAVQELPRVLLLDLDGTLIGHIGAVACEYEILKTTEKNGSKRLRAYKEQVVSRLRYGIVRPHVEAFLKHAAHPAQRLELFVYTASEPTWAAFIIPCVETALGVRFNRPLFTRAHCIPSQDVAARVRSGAGGSLQKSVQHVMPSIFTRLRRKYGLRSAAQLTQRVVLVDNTPDILIPTERDARMVTCPTYSYNYLYDVLGNVEVDVLHRRFQRIAPVLERAGLFPPSPAASELTSYQQFAALYYAHLGRIIAEQLTSNVDVLRFDRFFARLQHALSPHLAMAFTPEVMAAVRAAVRPTGTRSHSHSAQPHTRRPRTSAAPPTRVARTSTRKNE
jgi:hypothetical protein